MVTYNVYSNNIDHTWYDSSNLVYSACYDSNGDSKTLKVVFKGGRTYIYKDVSTKDYLMFSKGAQSNGEEFNRHIVKNYKGVRLGDTDLDKLEELKSSFMNEGKEVEDATTDLSYHLEINDNTGEFRLKLGDRIIYEGIEGQVSISNLFKSMRLACSVSELTEALTTEDDFEQNELV